jgi:hypothetical protein
MNNSDLIFKTDNNYFNYLEKYSDNIENINFLEGNKNRKITAFSTKDVKKLNLSNFYSKEVQKNSNPVLDYSYELNTKKIIEIPESNNLKSNKNNNKIFENYSIEAEKYNLIVNFNKAENLNLNENLEYSNENSYKRKIEDENFYSNFNDESISKHINVFADSDSDDEEKPGLLDKEITNDFNNNLENSKNKQTEKKAIKLIKILKENIHKNNNEKADFLYKKEENKNKGLKDLLRKQTNPSYLPIKIENKNNFYSVKAEENLTNKINFLDLPDKNKTDKMSKNIKSNIFNKNNIENESFENYDSANNTIDLNNSKADLDFSLNYKEIIEDNIIDNTIIQDQTNIKNIIQALDSRILQSTLQVEKQENELLKEKKEKKEIKNQRCRKFPEIQSNCSQIFNDTFIIHLANDQEEPEEETEKELNKAGDCKKDLSKLSNKNSDKNNNSDEKNEVKEKSVEKKAKVKDSQISQKEGINKFLLNAQRMIEEAKNKKALNSKADFNEEKQIKMFNPGFENISLKKPDGGSVESFNFIPKNINLDNYDKSKINNNSNVNNINNYCSDQQLNNKPNLNKGLPDTQLNNDAINNNQNIFNKNAANNSNLNNINMSGLVSELNDNSNINNPNNMNLPNLENIKNTFENNANPSQNNLNMSNNPSIPCEKNNQQLIQLLQTLLQNQNSNNLNNQPLMNPNNFNCINSINPGFLGNFANNINDSFNPNLIGNPINSFNNYNNNQNILLQRVPNSPLKDLYFQILNSRNSINQPQIPMHFPNNNNNNQIQLNLNMLLNANKNFNNFAPQNNPFNQFNLQNNINNSMFNNINNQNQNQNQNTNLLKLIEVLNNQNIDLNPSINPLNNVNLNNIPNNNFAGINNKNQYNMLNNKDLNFPWNYQNAFNNQHQMRNMNNTNNPNFIGNINLKNGLQNTNQLNPVNLKNINADLDCNEENSIYNSNYITKEKETCKYSNSKNNEDSNNSNKIKITSMLSEKKYPKDEFNNSKSSKFDDK